MQKLAVFLTGLLMISSQSEKFPGQSFDQVIAYQLPSNELGLPEELITNKGQVNAVGKAYLLQSHQVKKLLEILNDTLTYGAFHSYSHLPTAGFVFYYQQKIVNWVELALPTNSLQAKTRIKAQHTYYWSYDDGSDYELTGLSPYGRKALKNLVKAIGMKKSDLYHLTGIQPKWSTTN